MKYLLTLENYYNKRKGDSMFHLLMMYDDLTELTKILGNTVPSFDHFLDLIRNSPVDELHDILHLFYNPVEKNFNRHSSQYSVQEHIEEYEVIYIERKVGKHFSNNRDRFSFTLKDWYLFQYTGYYYILDSKDFDEYFKNIDVNGTIFDKIHEIRELYLKDKTSNVDQIKKLIKESTNKPLPNGILTKEGKELYFKIMKIIGHFKKLYNDPKSDEILDYVRTRLIKRRISTRDIDEIWLGYLEDDGSYDIVTNPDQLLDMKQAANFLYGYKKYGRPFIFAILAEYKINLYDNMMDGDYEEYDMDALKQVIYDMDHFDKLKDSPNIYIKDDKIYYKYNNKNI